MSTTNFQSITVEGNLGSDPELRYTNSGVAVCNFSVCCNRTWTSNGEQHNAEDWYRIETWGAMALACNQYLVKGRNVLVAASRIKGQAWINHEGKAMPVIILPADTVRFLGNNGNSKTVNAFENTDQVPF